MILQTSRIIDAEVVEALHCRLHKDEQKRREANALKQPVDTTAKLEKVIENGRRAAQITTEASLTAKLPHHAQGIVEQTDN